MSLNLDSVSSRPSKGGLFVALGAALATGGGLLYLSLATIQLKNTSIMVSEKVKIDRLQNQVTQLERQNREMVGLVEKVASIQDIQRRLKSGADEFKRAESEILAFDSKIREKANEVKRAKGKEKKEKEKELAALKAEARAKNESYKKQRQDWARIENDGKITIADQLLSLSVPARNVASPSTTTTGNTATASPDEAPAEKPSAADKVLNGFPADVVQPD